MGWAPGEFGIMDHNAIFANQRIMWHNEWKLFKQGSVITIWGNNGRVGMRLNGQDNKFVYNMKTTDLWLGFTLYREGDQIEIVGAQDGEQ